MKAHDICFDSSIRIYSNLTIQRVVGTLEQSFGLIAIFSNTSTAETILTQPPSSREVFSEKNWRKLAGTLLAAKYNVLDLINEDGALGARNAVLL